MFLIVWYVLVFALGAAVGSFLNVCIGRIPWEKSVFWPGSRCGACFQPVRWYDNIPLVSYWCLRGRCRTCGARFSVRYFVIELICGLGFLGLFYLEVILNIHNWEPLKNWAFAIEHGVIPSEGWILFGFHATLFSFLLAVSVCDFDRREIPLSMTFTGAFVGLVGAVLWPWPWPYSPEEAVRDIRVHEAKWNQVDEPWWVHPATVEPRTGLYPWPVWGPLPDALEPGGNWQTGLATGLAGLLVGTLLLRAVRFLFSTGLGIEAMGLGDADLMMMAGSFLGWQPVVVAFFVSVFPALFLGVFLLLVKKDNSLPFGPALALGVLITFLGWEWIGPPFRPLFFWWQMLAGMAVFACLFMLAAGFFLRRRRE